MNKTLSEFRSYQKLGLPQRPHDFPLHKRVFEWENVGRGLGVDLVGFGWVAVRNRNGMFVFRCDLGSVHWYAGGLVRLYVRGPVLLARVKELFCRAFVGVLGWEMVQGLLGGRLEEKERKWTFELGQLVPRFDIRKFERSHGIRIFADGSHPTAVHVVETAPFWLDRLEDVQKQLALNLETHLKVEDRTLKIVGGMEKFLGLSKPRKRSKKVRVPWEI